MGLDIQIIAKGDITPEQVAEANTYFHDRFLLDRDTAFDEKIEHQKYGASISSMSRYYGPGYERGHWPEIYALIRGMRACFPNATIHYGSDAELEESMDEVTDGTLAAIWNHWDGDNGQGYRNRMVR